MSSTLIEQQVNSPTIISQSLGLLNNNVYYLVNGKDCLVVDPTYDMSVVSFINDNRLNVVAIVLTHGHYDHCGGAGLLQQRFGLIDLYCSKADWLLCNNASKNRRQVTCCDCYPTFDLRNGEYDIHGFQLSVIETPGHTNGSVSIIVGDSILTGDTLFAGTVGRTDIGVDGDSDKLYSSLTKLKSLEKNYKVLSGHGRSTSLEMEKNTNPYLVNL